MPYNPGPYGQPPPPPPFVAPKKSRKGLIIGLAVLGVLLIGVVVAAAFFISAMKDTTIATDMKVGDCITAVPTDSRVLTLPTVDCAELHGGEVYAVIDMPEGDYPGQAKIDQYQNKCPDELATFAPAAMTDDAVGIYVLYPTPETWAQGDRAITCVATLDPKRAGSLKGAGLPTG
jgi:Septum formation